jgi:hypothetical protein
LGEYQKSQDRGLDELQSHLPKGTSCPLGTNTAQISASFVGYLLISIGARKTEVSCGLPVDPVGELILNPKS